MTDPYNLDRFVEAQKGIYEQALLEIRRARKTSHWMWFIFPQIAGLGRSPTAQFYAVSGSEEARSYLTHSLLGARLRECVEALQALPQADAQAVFGSIDAAKLRSSLTLFARAGGGPVFEQALDRWFGSEDSATVALLIA